MTDISRRNFLKLGAAGLGALAVSKIIPARANLADFPTDSRLGRVFHIVDVKAKPNMNSATLKTAYNDDVLVLGRELIGDEYEPLWTKNRVWYETNEGYISAYTIQLVKNLPNQPVKSLPQYGDTPGMWAEVTVPYVDLIFDGEPQSLIFKEMDKPRFYYSQVLWIDGITTSSNGEILYHVIERHGATDRFWAEAKAFRPITPEDVAPITPEIVNKLIMVDVIHQTMSVYENNKEILFTRISSGAKYDNDGNVTDKWSTPVGENHAINRKFISLHMAGGDNKASGFENPAVSWVSVFASGGVAIHGNYWHNNYGTPMSHGCVNCDPEVAKFIYRWSQPEVPYDPGKLEILGYSGTKVKVIEG